MFKILKYLPLFLSLSLTAQTDFAPNQSLKVQLSLPNSTANGAFKEIMQGLVNVSVGYQKSLYKGISVGAGVKYSYFTINEFKISDKILGGIHLTGPYAKLSHEKFYGKLGVDVGVRFGYSYNFTTNTLCKAHPDRKTNFESTYLEPVLGLALMASEKSSYRLVLSYAAYGFKFSPNHLCLEEFTDYKKTNLDKFSQVFSVGFGYSFYFGN